MCDGGYRAVYDDCRDHSDFVMMSVMMSVTMVRWSPRQSVKKVRERLVNNVREQPAYSSTVLCHSRIKILTSKYMYVLFLAV